MYRIVLFYIYSPCFSATVLMPEGSNGSSQPVLENSVPIHHLPTNRLIGAFIALLPSNLIVFCREAVEFSCLLGSLLFEGFCEVA
jgi:hypothetical protein